MPRSFLCLLIVPALLLSPLAGAQDIKSQTTQSGKSAEPIAPRFKPSPAPKKIVQIGEIAWLSGCWKARQGSNANNTEQWTKALGPMMLGLGMELRGSQIASYEYMRIEFKDGKLLYAAKPHDKAERVFTQMSENPEVLMFESGTAEFPQRVTYRRDGDAKLEIRVEGEVSGKMRAALFPMDRTACN
jgi:hypothetical protein